MTPTATVAGRIAAFDPGLHRTGYAVVEASAGGAVHIVEAGVLLVRDERPLADRLQDLHQQALELLTEHRPTTLVVEELFSHYERVATAILMGHARGVLLLAARQAGAEVIGYMPTAVKKTMTGHGRASKAQMQRAVQLEFGLPEPPEPPDVADALALALCHFHDNAVRRRARGA